MEPAVGGQGWRGRFGVSSAPPSEAQLPLGPGTSFLTHTLQTWLRAGLLATSGLCAGVGGGGSADIPLQISRIATEKQR